MTHKGRVGALAPGRSGSIHRRAKRFSLILFCVFEFFDECSEIRRGVAPCAPQSNVNPARDRRAALMVIGRLLKDQYNALATPVPPHLAALVESSNRSDQQ
jgi:hypothetical protein